MTGEDHSQRTNARSADPRRAARERRDPRAAGAADRSGRRDAGRDDRPRRAGCARRRSASTCWRSARTPIRRSCKILDFGKFKYEQQKKKNEAKKKQKVIEIKEIKVRPNIDENDYQVKMRAMKSFIEEGDKVKVTLRFRGREMAHQEIGVRVLERIKNEMDPTSKVEQMPRMENRQMVMVLTPR